MILVTGATGFVGGYLVPRLLAGGHAVRCLVRKERDAERLRALGVDVRRGDITTAGVDELLEGVDSVINLVTIIRETPQSNFRTVNYEGPLRLLRAAERRGGVRFIHVSALGSRPAPELPYIHYKWLLEQEIERSPLDYTILKTSLVFGRGDQSLSFLAWIAGAVPGVHPVPGRGDTRYHPIWVEDLVTCIIKSLTEGAARRATLGVGGGRRHLSYDDLVDLLLRATGRRRRKLHLPRLAFRPAVRLLERVMAYPPVTTEMLRLLDVDSVAPLDAVQRHFGFTPAGLDDDEQTGYLRQVGAANLGAWLRGQALQR